MVKLRVIYTPEADEFRLNNVERIMSIRNPKNPLLQKLRGNYRKLRQPFPDIPEQVGVVTYNNLFKNVSKRMLSELENPDTTYMPLVVLEEACNLRNEDLENPIKRDYVYRAIGRVMHHSSVLLDRQLTSSAPIMLSSNIPSFQKVLQEFRKAKKLLEKEKAPEMWCRTLEESIEVLKKMPTFDDLGKVKDDIQKRFEANKVSRGFPLYYLPRDSYFASIDLVGLEDRVEIPEIYEKTIEYIREGCRVSGLDEVPPKVQEELDALKRYRFGETRDLHTLDELLKLLPEPQTIITDLYIVDHFPELVERGFKAYEFRLSG